MGEYANAYRRALFRGGCVAQAFVNGRRCFSKWCGEHWVVDVLLLVCVRGCVSQPCDDFDCEYFLRCTIVRHVDVQCLRIRYLAGPFLVPFPKGCCVDPYCVLVYCDAGFQSRNVLVF